MEHSPEVSKYIIKYLIKNGSKSTKLLNFKHNFHKEIISLIPVTYHGSLHFLNEKQLKLVQGEMLEDATYYIPQNCHFISIAA